MKKRFPRDGRTWAVGIAVAVVAVNAAIALSDRAAELWNHTSESINASSDVVAEIVVSTGMTDSRGDWAVHSVLWALGGLIAVMLIRRPRHVAAVLTVFATSGLVLEYLQNVVTIERSAQAMDMVGNLIGLACGTALGCAVRWVLTRRNQPAMRGPST